VPILAGETLSPERGHRISDALIRVVLAHIEFGQAGVSQRPQPQHAVEYIIAKVMASRAKEITLCATGPLTNVVTADVLNITNATAMTARSRLIATPREW
jgi:inosine-uridine nucleoside N-ribohydrolase